MTVIQNYIETMKAGWRPKSSKPKQTLEEYYATTTPRQRDFNAAQLARFDKAARRFIMRPLFNTPRVQFKKLGWVSDHPLSSREKRLSTTGFIENPVDSTITTKVSL